jgi:hypothetical protein
MPCGGIYPIKGTWVEPIAAQRDESKPEQRCWVCGKGNTAHFCDEWDCYIHARCAVQFLQSEEGQCVIDHGHEVHLNFSIEGATV